MKKIFILIFCLVFTTVAQASSLNVLYFNDASALDAYTISQIKRMENIEGLYLLNAEQLTQTQLFALKELPLKELGLGVNRLCGNVRRAISAMSSLTKLDLRNIVKVKDECLDAFTNKQLIELDIRSVKKISPAFADFLSKSKIRKLNIASVEEFSPELLAALSKMRLLELNIGAIDKLDPAAVAQINNMRYIKTLKFGINKDLNTKNHDILKTLVQST